MDLVSRYKTISIATVGVYTPGIMHKKLKENYEKYKYCFRSTGHAGIDLGLEFPELLKILKLKEKYGLNKAYLPAGDVKWSRTAAKVLGKLFPKWGWEVVGTKLFPGGTMDFSLMLHDVKRKKADLIFLATDFDEYRILVKQWRTLKVPTLFFAMGVGTYPGLWEELEGKVNYIVTDGLTHGIVPCGGKLKDKVAGFLKAWKERWGNWRYLYPESFCLPGNSL